MATTSARSTFAARSWTSWKTLYTSKNQREICLSKNAGLQVAVDGSLPGKVIGLRGGGFQENNAWISSWIEAIEVFRSRFRL